jgi:DNA-directed RNA polymerase subunit omega
MLRPSYSELMTLLNEEQKTDNRITSRYTIVIATSKRARELIDGKEAVTEISTNKPVSIAVKELGENKLKITSLYENGTKASNQNENDYVEDKTMD